MGTFRFSLRTMSLAPSRLIPATLGELNAIGCPGRKYHTSLLQISRNAIDAAADLHSNNLNNTLPEDVHVSLKAYPILLHQTLMCSLPSCGICFSFIQLVLAHHNFTRVRNLHCGSHCITASARLCLCQRSRQGRRHLFTFSLSFLRQRQRLQETRTSPFSQPLPHGSHSQSPLPHTTPESSSSYSTTPSTPAPTSQLGKWAMAGPANSNVGNNKKTQNCRVLHLLCEHFRD